MAPSPAPYVMPCHGDARHRRSVVLVYVVAALLCGGLLWVESLRVDRASMAAAREAAPPMWNVRIVSCVPGSPIDWAAMTPTASPS